MIDVTYMKDFSDVDKFSECVGLLQYTDRIITRYLEEKEFGLPLTKSKKEVSIIAADRAILRGILRSLPVSLHKRHSYT